jgi:hypothetical protein
VQKIFYPALPPLVLWHFVLQGAGERVKLNINVPQQLSNYAPRVYALQVRNTHMHDTGFGFWSERREAFFGAVASSLCDEKQARLGLHTLPPLQSQAE